MSQGSILGPILFNTLLIATFNTLTGLLKTLGQESQSATGWFKQNEIIINADKFQAITLTKKETEAK